MNTILTKGEISAAKIIETIFSLSATRPCYKKKRLQKYVFANSFSANGKIDIPSRFMLSNTHLG